jgi:hypothetical protein
MIAAAGKNESEKSHLSKTRLLGNEPKRPRQDTEPPASHFREPTAAAGFSAPGSCARYEASRAVMDGAPRRCVPKEDRPARRARIRGDASDAHCASRKIDEARQDVRIESARRQDLNGPYARSEAAIPDGFDHT